MEYYKFEKYEIMIPKLFGVEVKKSMSAHDSRVMKLWTPDEFLIDAKNRLTAEQYKAVEKLFNFSKQYSDDLVLSVERKSVTNIRAAFEASPYNIKIKRVSGTLKGLEK